MKISLALVLVSLFVLTVAKSGFLHERREHHHHHHHHQCEGQDQSTNLGSTTHPAAAGPGTPIPVTTPTSNPNAAPYQGAPTPSVAHSSLASYPSPAILPAATYASSGGWVQLPKGEASFTTYTGCQEPSCGQQVSGYSAAVNQLAFGANQSFGDACGRCFKISATSDPYDDTYTGPWERAIVVKVTDLCPIGDGNNQWCGQRVSEPLNHYRMPMHFDLCADSGASHAFFPGTRGALLGTYEEVSCSEWIGSDGQTLWGGSCLKGEDADFWPAIGCGNSGPPPA